MIEKLLVANRGEIARRVMGGAHALGISCVAVCSDPDLDAPYVSEADEFVRLPGATPTDTYLDVDAVVGAALRSGADAVHPGYGFLSEDAGFARACVAAGLVFVGPPPEVIEAMGSKLNAKATMAAAGVPVLPTVEIPPGSELASAVTDATAALGWPVLVKASAGGGGRGMRVVEGPDALADAVASAQREASSAFGDGTVFVEPYVARPRHIEVQILGDTHGTLVHLFERECSIQRRHQKIIEESPSPVITPERRAELGAAAVTAARTIGYVNAGTVEFLVLPDGRFAFLEVNTRLQVEHPVTELVTGLDLVRLQLLVADGMALPPEVLRATISGHAIEARLYAEDATQGYRPSAGHLHRFRFPVSSGVRIDSGVEDGSEVSVHYDPMLAKVIAHAPTRTEAARALAGALERAQVHGVTTNRDLLVRILRHPEFLAGDIDTGFLVRHDPAVLGAPLADAPSRQRHAVAAALAGQAERRAQAPVLGAMPSGWRNNPSDPQSTAFTGPDGDVRVDYRFDRAGSCTFVTVDGTTPEGLSVLSCTPEAVVLGAQGVARRYDVARAGLTTFVDGPDGSSTFVEIERFPLPGSQLAAGALVAPLPGTVVKVAVAAGDAVRAGDTLVAIEAMKMEHEVRAPNDGTVTEVHVAAGEQVEAGRLLVVVDGPDPDAGRRRLMLDAVPDAVRSPGVLRIANCSGFFGDRLAAPRELLEGGPIDVLTGDYLAELTMLILWKSRQRDPALGYARTFYRQMEEVLGTCVERGVKVVANAGGLNPAGLAQSLRELAGKLGIDVNVAHVEGDDILARLASLQAGGDPLAHLDTGRPLAEAGSDPVSANAYLGGFGIAEALRGGADVVVTGRVTDASLVVGPAAWHFGWQRTDWDRLAGAVVVGHVIECGTQTTGGNYAFFREVPGLEHPGFPIAEMAEDGSAVITKHEGTGGLVSVGTVTAQLLYEIGAPLYANPDVVADFSTIRVEDVGADRVRVSGVRGQPAPEKLKVSINLLGGYRNTMTFVLTGLDIDDKAALVRRTMDEIVGGAARFADYDVRLLRTDVPDAPTNEQASAQLRVTVKDPDPEVVGRRFSNAATELALASYPGFYLTSPPGEGTAYGVFWPTLVPRHAVEETVVHHDGRRVAIAPGPAAGSTEAPAPGSTPGNGAADIPSPPTGETRRVALGTVIGGRSGDKGGNANVGLWARTAPGFAWLSAELTVARFRQLLPEAAALEIDRYELPNFFALNFVVHGLLGEGVASSTRPDPQAKSLGESLRARLVEVPVALLADIPADDPR